MRNSNGQFAVGSKHLVKHGMAHTPIYRLWRAMHNRCKNPNVAAYPDYGGRGIVVCERWQEFENFFADMGERPEGMSLDRIDNDGPYSPENCRWATRFEQAHNKRNLHLVTAFGRTQTISDWSRETGVKLGTIWQRLASGWAPETAVTSPPVPHRERKWKAA